MGCEAIRQKIGECSVQNIKIVDMVNVLEKGTIYGMEFTAAQVAELEKNLKDAANNLKSLAQEVKQLIT